MTEQTSPGDEYLAQRLRDALADDPRVGELGIGVTVVDGHVYLSGEVATHERQQAVAAVAAEVLPDHEVHNGVEMTSWSEADGMEMLP